MSARPGGPNAASPEKFEREILARLGLDPSASPEDIAAAHAAVSSYLAGAPRPLRAWARVQAAGADEAYAILTDPAALARAAALVGAGTRPAVVPGGSATPPAPRGTAAPVAAAAISVAAAPAAVAARPAAVDEEGRRIVSDDEIDALLAEVDPGIHRGVIGTADDRARAELAAADRAATRREIRAAAAVAAAPQPAAPRSPVTVFLAGALAVALVAVIGLGVLLLTNSNGAAAGIGAGLTPAPSTGPSLDMTAVTTLMQKLQANPNDATTLIALGDEYYKVADYKTAGDWFKKATIIDPRNIKAFLALGAAMFNAQNDPAAEAAWKAAVALDDTNVEAHYDLGFLYLNRNPPDMALVQQHWQRVVELDPSSDVAQTVKQHLATFASAAPVASGAAGASAAPSPAATAAPATPAPSAAPSPTPAASSAPSGAPSPVPSGSPAP